MSQVTLPMGNLLVIKQEWFFLLHFILWSMKMFNPTLQSKHFTVLLLYPGFQANLNNLLKLIVQIYDSYKNE